MSTTAETSAGQGNQTATLDFGHFCAEVPKSLHIGAYPRVFLIAAVFRAATKSLQTTTFTARDSWEIGVIAMQKVVGSNPISRFSRNPALGRDFVVQGAHSENQTTPHIADIPGTTAD